MCQNCQHIHCARLGCVQTIHEIQNRIEAEELKNQVLRRIDLKTIQPDYSHTVPASYYQALRTALRDDYHTDEIY